VNIACVAICLVALLGCGEAEREQKAASPRMQMERELDEVRLRLQASPEVPMLHFQLGQIHQKYGLVDSARNAFERSAELYEALQLRGQLFAEAHLQLAQIYYEDGDLEKSALAYEQTVRFDRENVVAYNNLGFVYKKLNRSEKAIQAYEQAIAADTLFAEAYNNLAQLLRVREEDQRAIDLLQRAIALKPDFSEAYVNLAGIYEGQQADKEAAVWRNFLEHSDGANQYSVHAKERLHLLTTP